MITGTIFDIKKFAVHDGPGIRTTVFFKGCPLNCWWCHNPESRLSEPETIEINAGNDGQNSSNITKKEVIGRIVSVDEIVEEIRKDEIFYDQSGGGATFSGGEPLAQIDFLYELLKTCKENDISTVVDTCGYAPFEDFEMILDFVDCFLYDIKLMDEKKHLEYTGVSQGLILENLGKLSQKKAKINPRIPLIPGITDSIENLSAIAEYIDKLNNIKEVSLLPYNLFAENKKKRFNLDDKIGHLEIQTDNELLNMSEPFKLHGFEVKIGG